ncbi:MAG TPA: hypothetical protein ENK18_27480 [Deltaproteobacteria bacterium]|nr:hypothetical protein [Deltaproteobacteria bacterium]
MNVLIWIGALAGCSGPALPPEEPPTDPSRIVCVGEATVETDGQLESTLVRGLDAQLRTVSDEVWGADGVLQSVIQSRYEGELLVERIVDDDGDGESDFTEVWTYDEAGVRELYEVYYVDTLSQIEAWSYDAEGNLVEEWIDLNADETPEEIRTHVWSGGRVERIDTHNAGGTLIVTSSFAYTEPFPSIDHEERLDLAADGVIDDTILRAFDAQGRRIREEGLGPGVWYVLEQRWRDDDDRLTFRSEETTHSLHTDRWTYSGDGLLLDRITERDDGLDSILEWRTVEQWRWTCED